MTESQLSNQIRAALKMFGCAVYSVERLRHQGTAGVPDLIVFNNDRWTFAEIKLPKGRMSQAQRAFESECKRVGAPHCVWKSVQDALDWSGRTAKTGGVK